MKDQSFLIFNSIWHTKMSINHFLLFALLAATQIVSEEPLPPSCSTFYGRICDSTLQSCVFSNSSNTEAQCKCSETHVKCLRDIDPKQCLRGAHCKLYYSTCINFYCQENPIVRFLNIIQDMSSYPYQFQYVCVICIYTSIHLSMITLYSILTFSS